MDRALAHVDSSYDMVLGIREVDVPVRGRAHSFRPRERCISGRPAIAAEALLSGAGKSVNDGPGKIELQDRFSFPQSQPQVSGGVKIKSAWYAEGDFLDRTVPDRPSLAGAGKGGDNAGLHIHLANAMVFHVANVKIPRLVETNAMGFVELGLFGRPAIAGETCRAGSGYGIHHASFGVASSHL